MQNHFYYIDNIWKITPFILIIVVPLSLHTFADSKRCWAIPAHNPLAHLINVASMNQMQKQLNFYRVSLSLFAIRVPVEGVGERVWERERESWESLERLSCDSLTRFFLRIYSRRSFSASMMAFLRSSTWCRFSVSRTRISSMRRRRSSSFCSRYFCAASAWARSSSIFLCRSSFCRSRAYFSFSSRSLDAVRRQKKREVLVGVWGQCKFNRHRHNSQVDGKLKKIRSFLFFLPVSVSIINKASVLLFILNYSVCLGIFFFFGTAGIDSFDWRHRRQRLLWCGSIDNKLQ